MPTPASLVASELMTFVPARDFAVSKRFYTDLGFTQASEGGGIAAFRLGAAGFLLQDYYVKEFAENLQLHLLVEDVEAWHAHADTALKERYGVRVTSLENQPWGTRDFTVTDPCGVCWRIGQNMD